MTDLETTRKLWAELLVTYRNPDFTLADFVREAYLIFGQSDIVQKQSQPSTDEMWIQKAFAKDMCGISVSFLVQIMKGQVTKPPPQVTDGLVRRFGYSPAQIREFVELTHRKPRPSAKARQRQSADLPAVLSTDWADINQRRNLMWDEHEQRKPKMPMSDRHHAAWLEIQIDAGRADAEEAESREQRRSKHISAPPEPEGDHAEEWEATPSLLIDQPGDDVETRQRRAQLKRWIEELPSVLMNPPVPAQAYMQQIRSSKAMHFQQKAELVRLMLQAICNLDEKVVEISAAAKVPVSEINRLRRRQGSPYGGLVYGIYQAIMEKPWLTDRQKEFFAQQLARPTLHQLSG